MEERFVTTCQLFWHTYYQSMAALHSRQRRIITEPLRDRNLGTTDSKHVTIFESYWQTRLAEVIGVDPSEVGKRKIVFRGHRSKSFDVCWPLTGEPKILISCKSMQNAYRNFTNRIEEAFGDSAVLRLYRSNAVFGFFFFMLDGNVPRGVAEKGKKREGHVESGKGKGVAPFLDLVEEGGDFFDLSNVDEHRKKAMGKPRRRQDVIAKAELSLIDLAATEAKMEGAIHYDAIAYTPVRFSKENAVAGPSDWNVQLSQVNDMVSYELFLERLVATAKLRGFI